MPTSTIDVNKLPLECAGGLIEILGKITDPRHRQGIRYPFASMLALAVLARASAAESKESER